MKMHDIKQNVCFSKDSEPDALKALKTIPLPEDLLFFWHCSEELLCAVAFPKYTMLFFDKMLKNLGHLFEHVFI